MPKLFMVAFLFLTSCFLFSTPALAQTTQAWSDKCVGTGTSSDVATIQGFECLFYNVLQVITALAGIAFFIMFISGGFNYLFSGNDDKKIAAIIASIDQTVSKLKSHEELERQIAINEGTINTLTNDITNLKTILHQCVEKEELLNQLCKERGIDINNLDQLKQ